MIQEYCDVIDCTHRSPCPVHISSQKMELKKEERPRDEYGFEFDPRFFDAQKMAEFKSTYDPVLERRSHRWQKLLDKVGQTGKLPRDKKDQAILSQGSH